MWSLSTRTDGRGRLDEQLALLLEDRAETGDHKTWPARATRWTGSVTWALTGGQGGAVLSVHLIPRLAALPIKLGLDIYG